LQEGVLVTAKTGDLTVGHIVSHNETTAEVVIDTTNRN